MFTKWDENSIGGFLSLSRTEMEIMDAYPTSPNSTFAKSNFRAKELATKYWREPLLEFLLRYPKIRVAFALDLYRIGFFQLVSYKKSYASESFIQFCTQILFSSQSNPYCMLAIIKGQTCKECAITELGIFEPTGNWHGLYDRCASAKAYEEIWQAIHDIRAKKFRCANLGVVLRYKGYMGELQKIAERLKE